jgi:hypothetical protein
LAAILLSFAALRGAVTPGSLRLAVVKQKLLRSNYMTQHVHAPLQDRVLARHVWKFVNSAMGNQTRADRTDGGGAPHVA